MHGGSGFSCTDRLMSSSSGRLLCGWFTAVHFCPRPSILRHLLLPFSLPVTLLSDVRPLGIGCVSNSTRRRSSLEKAASNAPHTLRAQGSLPVAAPAKCQRSKNLTVGHVTPPQTHFCMVVVRAPAKCQVSSFSRSGDVRGVPKFKSGPPSHFCEGDQDPRLTQCSMGPREC